MHSTYPAGTFPKLMRDEITAPPPGVPVDSHAVYSKDTGGAAPSLPALPASFSFNLFYLCFFPSSFFRPRGPSSLLSSPLLSSAPRTHEERGRGIRFNSFGRSERAFTLYKKLPLIFDGTSSAPGVSKRNFPVIGGGYFSSL